MCYIFKKLIDINKLLTYCFKNTILFIWQLSRWQLNYHCIFWLYLVELGRKLRTGLSWQSIFLVKIVQPKFFLIVIRPNVRTRFDRRNRLNSDEIISILFKFLFFYPDSALCVNDLWLILMGPYTYGNILDLNS